MKSEDYVRPPLVGREPAPGWLARWRFRLVVAVVLIGLAVACLAGFRALSGATRQDPGVTPHSLGGHLTP